MNVWKYSKVLLLCILVHKSWAKIRNVLMKKMPFCTSSAQLAGTQRFTPVSSVAQCVLHYLHSGENLMLVRYGADGAIECGHTRTPPTSVSCNTRGDVTLFQRSAPSPAPLLTLQHCPVHCDQRHSRGGDTICVHKSSQNVPYQRAEYFCSSIGGKIIEMETVDELVRFQNYNIGGFWVDAVAEGNGQYSWKSGPMVQQDLFKPNQPDQDDENCLAFDNYYPGLFDLECDTNQPVVCEINCH